MVQLPAVQSDSGGRVNALDRWGKPCYDLVKLNTRMLPLNAAMIVFSLLLHYHVGGTV